MSKESVGSCQQSLVQDQPVDAFRRRVVSRSGDPFLVPSPTAPPPPPPPEYLPPPPPPLLTKNISFHASTIDGGRTVTSQLVPGAAAGSSLAAATAAVEHQLLQQKQHRALNHDQGQVARQSIGYKPRTRKRHHSSDSYGRHLSFFLTTTFGVNSVE